MRSSLCWYKRRSLESEFEGSNPSSAATRGDVRPAARTPDCDPGNAGSIPAHPPSFDLWFWILDFGLACEQSKIQNRKSNWGDVSDSNRRRLIHSQESSPLDEHPHKSCGERTRTFELRCQKPALLPTEATPHRMVPPRGFKPRTVRLEDACAVHLRHGGEWCIWRDLNSHCAGSKPAASTNWATDALVR